MMDLRPSTPEEKATWRAMNRALLLVLAPGGLLVFGLIAWLKPALPSPSALSGCYGATNGAIIRVGPKSFELLDGSRRTSAAQAQIVKGRYYLNLDHGYTVEEPSPDKLTLLDAYPKGQMIPVTIDNGHVSLLLPSKAGVTNVWEHSCP